MCVSEVLTRVMRTVERGGLAAAQLVGLPQRRDLAHQVLDDDALLVRREVRPVVLLQQVGQPGVLVPAHAAWAMISHEPWYSRLWRATRMHDSTCQHSMP